MRLQTDPFEVEVLDDLDRPSLYFVSVHADVYDEGDEWSELENVKLTVADENGDVVSWAWCDLSDREQDRARDELYRLADAAKAAALRPFRRAS